MAYALSSVQFGTDGWRALIDEDFNPANLARVVEAAGKVFASDIGGLQAAEHKTLVIGYDCRRDAGKYAALAASVLAQAGFDVKLSRAYCPTPALCWSIARDAQAIGGLMLTSSHNPAEWLGLKLRMADGGASPKEFTDRVEAALAPDAPASFIQALDAFEEAANGRPDAPAHHLQTAPDVHVIDLTTPYLDDLYSLVDADLIAGANIKVVVDPLFGAGRLYLASVLKRLGVEVAEVNNATDTTFNGLHPEPIEPWIKVGQGKVVEHGYDACFITDGDADRIGAADADGNFVNPHRILTLLIAALVEGKGAGGRVVRTSAGSNLLKRQCERLGLELTTTPIGFKWIYEEMLKGDVLIGGEESGGIGIPGHVRERDGLYMALLLTELMARKQKALGELVAELLDSLGSLEYSRRDLRLEAQVKEAFLAEHVRNPKPLGVYVEQFAPHGYEIVCADHRDGLKLDFADDSWLLMRPSGTEPLVRVYAEAPSAKQVEQLLELGVAIVKNKA